jgi:hypothetical protein
VAKLRHARSVRRLLAVALLGLGWLLAWAPAAVGQAPTVLVTWWRAHRRDGPLAAGQPVRVLELDGLSLVVEPTGQPTEPDHPTIKEPSSSRDAA